MLLLFVLGPLLRSSSSELRDPLLARLRGLILWGVLDPNHGWPGEGKAPSLYCLPAKGGVAWQNLDTWSWSLHDHYFQQLACLTQNLAEDLPVGAGKVPLCNLKKSANDHLPGFSRRFHKILCKTQARNSRADAPLAEVTLCSRAFML